MLPVRLAALECQYHCSLYILLFFYCVFSSLSNWSSSNWLLGPLWELTLPCFRSSLSVWGAVGGCLITSKAHWGKHFFFHQLRQNPMLCGQHNGFHSEPCIGQLSWYGWETFHQLLWTPSLYSLPLLLASMSLDEFYNTANHPDWDFTPCCTVAQVISLTKVSFTKSLI